jgi:hypothetical protein
MSGNTFLFGVGHKDIFLLIAHMLQFFLNLLFNSLYIQFFFSFKKIKLTLTKARVN